MSDTSSDEFFSEGIQPHSHDPAFSMAPVVAGNGGLEEESNDHKEVAQRIGNANWCQCGKCCSMQTA